jgi:predicted TIM-barrel fold metal-dependent hydrolase
MVISSDGHVAALMPDYREYLEQDYREEFDDFLVDFDKSASKVTLPDGRQVATAQPLSLFPPALVAQYTDRVVNSGALEGEWDPGARVQTLTGQGVVADVLFPNRMPFQSEIRLAGSRAHELRRAGRRAYNRWLADYCARHPDQLAGMLSVDFDDIDAAVAEIKWAKQAGLRGVILPTMEGPGTLDGPESSDPCYEPIWAACAELELPLNIHTVGPDIKANLPPERWIAVFGAEFNWGARRHLWHLIYGGVLERHPTLRVVFTEQHSDWVPGTLRSMDYSCKSALFSATVGSTVRLLPSEYFARQCFLGGSILSRIELGMYDEIGPGKLMFGADLPHIESTWTMGSTTEFLRAVAADNGVNPADLRDFSGRTAADVFGFDAKKLQHLVDSVGPDVEETLSPLPQERFAEMSAGDIGRPRRGG